MVCNGEILLKILSHVAAIATYNYVQQALNYNFILYVALLHCTVTIQSLFSSSSFSV